MQTKYKVLRSGRSSMPAKAGETLFPGRDLYGIASDDSRILGFDVIAVSYNQSGEPFFTIPREDVVQFRE